MNSYDDPFERHGKLARTHQYMRFAHKHGQYQVGIDNDPIAVGTRLVTDMKTYKIGWIRWKDNEATIREMGYVADGYLAKQRRELGDLDSRLWDTVPGGTFDTPAKKDPWSEIEEIMLTDPGTDESFIFTATSGGAMRALRNLCAEYGKERKNRPDQDPLIELAVDEWESKKYGLQKSPKFLLVGWAKAGSGTRSSDRGLPGNSGGGLFEPLAPKDDLSDAVPF